MTKEAKIIFSITGIVIIAVLLLMALSPKQVLVNAKIVDAARLVTDTSHMTGKKDAKVTIVEFGDYQCPACGATNPLLKQVIDVYGKNPDFNFVFRHFPLPMHANAMIAAEAAEAASAQGKFWEMNDLLYENQGEWSESSTPIDFFIKYAEQLKLDTAKFKKELQNHTYEDFINTDKADGNAIDVLWTPSIYINGELQQQTPTLQQFKSKIDSLLLK